MKRVLLVLLFASAANAATTLTFPAALERTMRTHGAAAHYDEQAKTLESLTLRTLPSVRAETGFSSAEDLNLITQSLDRFDAFTALVQVDYPVLDGGNNARRIAEAKADAQLLRRRARDDAEDLFRQTLEAFAQLYTAQARMELLHEGAARAAALRQRARTMLEAGQISNLVAAQWQDQALVTESLLVDLELQRLEAETRLKQLTGDTSDEPLLAKLEIESEPLLQKVKIEDAIEHDAAVTHAVLLEQRKQLALQDALASRKPQMNLSAFGGVAALPRTSRINASDGFYGLYGLRVSLSLPMFDAAAARRVAEARLEAEEAARARRVTSESVRHRLDLLWLSIAATDKRIELLTEAVDVAKKREESVTRLVLAGVRPEADLVDAANATARREADLLAVRVERWKLQQRVKWAGESDSRVPPSKAASLRW